MVAGAPGYEAKCGGDRAHRTCWTHYFLNDLTILRVESERISCGCLLRMATTRGIRNRCQTTLRRSDPHAGRCWCDVGDQVGVALNADDDDQQLLSNQDRAKSPPTAKQSTRSRNTTPETTFLGQGTIAVGPWFDEMRTR